MINDEREAASLGLQRFVKAQAPLYNTVLKELQNGDKRTHWMWFIFPQIDGLGTSPTAMLYAIKDMEEAIAYAAHPVLGARLLECSLIVAGLNGKSAHDIFGFPDEAKLQSCITLFSIVSPTVTVFAEVLSKYFNNEKDQRTIKILHGDRS